MAAGVRGVLWRSHHVSIRLVQGLVGLGVVLSEGLEGDVGRHLPRAGPWHVSKKNLEIMSYLSSSLLDMRW